MKRRSNFLATILQNALVRIRLLRTCWESASQFGPLGKAARFSVLAGGSLLLLTGCESVEKYSLTHRLWNGEDTRTWNEPASAHALALFEDVLRSDVLVQYEALSGKRSTVQRQAYYLTVNRSRIAEGKKPQFAKPEATIGLKTIAVLPLESRTNVPPATEPYALTAVNSRRFTLCRPGAASEDCELPVFPEGSDAVRRVALTPFAVVGDVVMVGLFLGFIAALMYHP